MAVLATLNFPEVKLKGDAEHMKRYEEPFGCNDDPDLGLEDVKGYRSGSNGFHPVDIGDMFRNERYKVLHKLGSGGYATVWLARDRLNRRYVALRISRASVKGCTRDVDLEVLAYLQDKISRVGGPGSEFIDVPVDSFHIKGPNGRHHCLVSKLAGPRLWPACRKIDEGRAKKAARQLTQALAFLHSEEVGIVHSDLTDNNVLLELKDINDWPPSKIYAVLGRPVREAVRLRPGVEANPAEAPRFWYRQADVMKLLPHCSDNIRVIDFGGSFFAAHAPADTTSTVAFAPPELVLEGARRFGTAMDVWALGCLVFELMACEWLFENEGTLVRMKELLGPLLVVDEGRGDGKMLGPLRQEGYSKAKKIRYYEADALDFLDLSLDESEPELTLKGMIAEWCSTMSRAEREVFLNFLQKALRYDPEERASAAELLSHEWLAGGVKDDSCIDFGRSRGK